MGNLLQGSGFLSQMLSSIRSIFGESREGKTTDEENYTTNNYEQSQTERKLLKKEYRSRVSQETRYTAQYGKIDDQYQQQLKKKLEVSWLVKNYDKQTQKQYQRFPDDEALYIEHYYQEFIKNQDQKKNKFVFLNGKYYIDLQYLVQKDILQYEQPIQIKRSSFKEKQLYNLNDYFISTQTGSFEQKNNRKSVVIDQKEDNGQNWLGHYFWVKNGAKFPTPNQIIEGIIEEAAQLVEQEYEPQYTMLQKKNLKLCKREQWLQIFNRFELENLDKEIQWEEVEDPMSKIRQAILFIYQMDTFIPYAIDKAIREKDESKLNTLGPFSFLLRRIVFMEQKLKKQKNNQWEEFQQLQETLSIKNDIDNKNIRFQLVAKQETTLDQIRFLFINTLNLI